MRRNFLRFHGVSFCYSHVNRPTPPVHDCFRRKFYSNVSRAMTKHIRVGILECDSPLEQTRAKYGGYGGVFAALLKAGAAALDKPEEITPDEGLDISYWDVVKAQEYPPLEEVDALLITGSRYDCFNDDEWILKLVNYTKTALDRGNIRIIGVCFGHQIIARAMGAKTGRNDRGWEISVSPMKMTEAGKKLFGKDTMSLQQMHRDVVYEIPEEVEALGSSEACNVQGMYKKGRVITVQGHPEFNEQIVKELLQSRRQNGTFSGELYTNGMDRVGDPDDSIIVGKAFVQFLIEDRD